MWLGRRRPSSGLTAVPTSRRGRRRSGPSREDRARGRRWKDAHPTNKARRPNSRDSHQPPARRRWAGRLRPKPRNRRQGRRRLASTPTVINAADSWQAARAATGALRRGCRLLVYQSRQRARGLASGPRATRQSLHPAVRDRGVRIARFGHRQCHMTVLHLRGVLIGNRSGQLHGRQIRICATAASPRSRIGPAPGIGIGAVARLARDRGPGAEGARISSPCSPWSSALPPCE